MRSYLILANWTDQGVKNSRDTLKRAGAFRALIESRGGKLREHLYTLGEYDIVMVTECPDDDTAAAARHRAATTDAREVLCAHGSRENRGAT